MTGLEDNVGEEEQLHALRQTQKQTGRPHNNSVLSGCCFVESQHRGPFSGSRSLHLSRL